MCVYSCITMTVYCCQPRQRYSQVLILPGRWPPGSLLPKQPSPPCSGLVPLSIHTPPPSRPSCWPHQGSLPPFQQRQLPPTHTHTLYFSPVNVYFATASLDTTARLWTTDQVFPLRVFAGHTASVDVSCWPYEVCTWWECYAFPHCNSIWYMTTCNCMWTWTIILS